MSDARIVPLSKSDHAKLTFTAVPDFSFAAALTTMPLMGFEVPPAARCFAIAFAPSGAATPHALLGLGDKNIFVDENNRWTAPYLPLFAANHPFSLVAVPPAEDGSKRQPLLAIDENAPHFASPDGQPLYTPAGEPTETLTKILETLADQHQAFELGVQPLTELALSGVLVDGHVVVGQGEKARSVSGLRIADRKKVMALPEVTLGKWVKTGIMEMLYAHWASMSNLQVLLDHPSCPASAASGLTAPDVKQ